MKYLLTPHLFAAVSTVAYLSCEVFKSYGSTGRTESAVLTAALAALVSYAL